MLKAIYRVLNGVRFKFHTLNGGSLTCGYAAELLTLNTGAVFTESNANLLPANAVIDAVAVRITTTITTATMWQVGDSSTPGRFTDWQTTLTAGTTVVGLAHLDQVGPPRGVLQSAAAKVRVTLDANPGTGAVRLEVWYRQIVAPTS